MMNKQTELTQDYLKSILDYDARTGIFWWKVDRAKNVKAGDVAGYIQNTGARSITIDKKLYLAHRLAWLYVYGYMPNVIDHINRVRADNRIENLRDTTQCNNQKNSALRVNNKSGIKNVSWDKALNKWKVQIRVDGEHKHIGVFDNLEIAGLAAQEARNKYHGEFANHG